MPIKHIYLYFFLLWPTVSLAGGPVHGSKAAGMGTAFIAVADDPSAILHNPAGISYIEGNNLYGGFTTIAPSSSYESNTGEQEDTDFQLFFPPHLYYTRESEFKDITLGIGLYSPFGIGGRKWSDTGLTRYLSTEGSIATVAVNPTVSWKFHPTASLAIGLDYMYARKEGSRMIDFGTGDGLSNIEADGGGWGYNFGLLWSAPDNFRIGLAYRSSINVKFEGELTVTGIAPALQSAFGGAGYTTDVSTESDFPESYGFGIAYIHNKKLTLAMDVELVRWSSFDQSHLDIANEVPAAGLVDSTTILDWEDSLQFKLGIEYRLNDKYSLRGGYAYIPTMVPEHTMDPGNPDADSHNISIGFGRFFNNWTLDGFYNLGLYEDRKVDNEILDGTYGNLVHAFGFSVLNRF
ncbi:MAG: outer membrane protein transport protein [Proteobacteria bacterium]|nr:outer membrane protein transport protein [Pseudomonadota bacterium]MBU1711383.1 outer membrane protein transport protein [Pseudomonadota bacterium]